MRNLSSLFSRNEEGFHGNLNLSPTQKAKLKAAKIKIQEHLRTGISEIVKAEYDEIISPRFLSQGSSVYKTQNKPCINPPQQIDHDLGCYLPLSYIDDNDHPVLASEIFFTIVDKLLEVLVKKENWKSVVTTKKTCSRVIVNNEIHIDVPLYSIPDKEFQRINEVAKSMKFLFSDMRMDSITQEEWDEIKEQVLLAHRTMGWKPSDPRKLNKYFKQVFEVKGEQLRRICRYLKAWRDFRWKEGGPSSIYLMILADSIFLSEINRRDDIALLKLLQEFPNKLSTPITNPTDKSEIIEIPDNILTELKTYASDFTTDLHSAIYQAMSSGDSCHLIRRHLGDRFPYDNTLPFDDDKIRETVLSTPVTKEPDRVPNNRSRAG